MAEQYTEVKEKLDEVGKLIHDFQDEHKKLSTEGKSNSEKMEKLSVDLQKKSEEFQDVKNSLEAEKKAREQLEIAMAKMGGSNQSQDGIKGSREYRKEFKKYLTNGGRHQIELDAVNSESKSFINLMDIEEEKANEIKGMYVGSNPDGGYFVPIDLQSTILQRQFETSPMRPISNVTTTSSDIIMWPLSDGQNETGWVGELDARAETDTAKIGVIEIPVREIYANPWVTQKMLDDSAFNVEAFLQGELVRDFTIAENTAFVNGATPKRPYGFMIYPAWATVGVYQRGALEDITTAAVGTVSPDDLIDVQASLLEYYQPGAVWTMSRQMWASIVKLKDNDNQYLINPMMLFDGTRGLHLLGKPVVLMSDMPTTITEDEYALAYGNFREGYTIVDRIGIRVLRDPYTEKGKIFYYTTKRVGGGVTNFQAIKRLLVQAS